MIPGKPITDDQWRAYIEAAPNVHAAIMPLSARPLP